MNDSRERTDAEQLDVGAILEWLRADVRARRQAQNQEVQRPIERDLRRSLDEIELYRVVSAHWPLLGKTLPQRAITLINKLVRRYLRWYINPIVEQQNAYNDAVARTLALLADAYDDLAAHISEPSDQPNDQPAGDQSPGTSHETPQDESPASSGRAPDYAALMAVVRERAAVEPPARFPDLELRALEPQLRLRQEVSAHWPLAGKTAPQRAIALLNKLVRRYLRWYINPIVQQQNAANAAFTAVLLKLIQLDAERRAQVASRRAKAR